MRELWVCYSNKQRGILYAIIIITMLFFLINHESICGRYQQYYDKQNYYPDESDVL